ncbi:MAG TPA: hypothetical protein VHJ19_02970 [Gammaproteobacteria bacterium]|nr:hypothetical protein [Gammaproteobacteria bacterium]
MRLVTYDYNQKHQLAVVQDNWVIIPSLVGGRPLEVVADWRLYIQSGPDLLARLR